MAIKGLASDRFSGTQAAHVGLAEFAAPLAPSHDLPHEAAQPGWAETQPDHQRRKSMTKRIRAWWLALLSATFFVAVEERHHQAGTYPEFAEFQSCSDARSRAVKNAVPELIGISAGHCYVGSRQPQPIEIGAPLVPLRKEPTNGDSHKDSNRITAYVPTFCPV